MIFIIMPKLIISEKQFKILKEHIIEDISRDDANRDSNSVDTVINKQRNVGFIPVRGKEGQYELNRAIKAGLGLIKFRQDTPDKIAYVIYNHGHEKQAQELANIAIKHGGYLPAGPHQGITAEEVYRIGRLLEYNRDEVIDFVCTKFNLDPSYFENTNIYN